MVRIAIQVKELISSNVTGALDSASDPAKLLLRLQREIEEALIGLAGETTKARRCRDRLKTELVEANAREAAWDEKARIAMDNAREDLARQALLAREDTRNAIARIKKDIAALDGEMNEIQEAEIQLEAKRDDVRQRLSDQLAAGGNVSGNAPRGASASRTERRMDHIADLEKRTGFAVEGSTAGRSNAAIEREIEDMVRTRRVDEELAAMRDGAAANAARPKRAGKKGSKAA